MIEVGYTKTENSDVSCCEVVFSRIVLTNYIYMLCTLKNENYQVWIKNIKS